MGFDQEEFIQAFVGALTDNTVIEKLQKAVCGQIHKEVGELREIIKNKDDQIRKLEVRVRDLELKQDDAEQYSRRNSIRITGIDESASEDISEKIIKLCNESLEVEPPVTLEQFDRIHRVGQRSEDSPRPVLVKFATYRTRNVVFRSRRKLRQKNRQEQGAQAEADDHSKQETIRPIYINEDLTKYRAHLLYLARQKKSSKVISDCWSWDGTILVKTKHPGFYPFVP